MLFRRVLSLTVNLIDLPFGFTLTIWSSGVIIVRRYAFPSLLDVFLFVAGAIAAFLLIDIASYHAEAQQAPSRRRVRTLINICPILALAVVAGLAQLPLGRGPTFALGGFAATLTYILSMAALIYLDQVLTARGR